MSPTDIAVVLSTSGINSGVTHDHEKLKQTILNLRVESFLRTNENECHNINYYMGDQIANKAEVLALQAAAIKTMHCFTKGLTREAAESIVQTGSARAVELGEQTTERIWVR